MHVEKDFPAFFPTHFRSRPYGEEQSLRFSFSQASECACPLGPF
jgi:hypothetical protein